MKKFEHNFRCIQCGKKLRVDYEVKHEGWKEIKTGRVLGIGKDWAGITCTYRCAMQYLRGLFKDRENIAKTHVRHFNSTITESDQVVKYEDVKTQIQVN